MKVILRFLKKVFKKHKITWPIPLRIKQASKYFFLQSNKTKDIVRGGPLKLNILTNLPKNLASEDS